MKTNHLLAIPMALCLFSLSPNAQAAEDCGSTPDAVNRGNIHNLTLTGQDFSGVTEVDLGDPRIRVIDFGASGTDLDLTIRVGERAVAGLRDIAVTTDSGSIVCSDVLEIIPGQPALIALEPGGVSREDTQTIVVQGESLDALQGISLGDGVTTESYLPDQSDPTRAEVSVAVAADADAGFRDVVGLTGDIDIILVNGFEVVPGTLSADSASPETLVRGESATLTVTGANLDVVDTLSLGSGVSFGTITSLQPGSLEVDVTVLFDALPVGESRDLTLSGAGQSFTFEDALTIDAGAATLTRLQPAQIRQGASLELRLDGTNLDGLDTFDAGDGLTATGFDVLAPTRVLVEVAVDDDAAIGLRDVSVSGTFGAATLDAGLRINEAVDPDPRVNFPSVADAGRVAVGSRKRVSMLFINEIDLNETVEVQVLTGDIDEFALVDEEGETLARFYPDAFSFELGPLAERLVTVEFRPSLRSASSAELQVVVRGEELGRADLRGTGVDTTLSYSPSPPLTLPLVPEGEQASRQVSTLSSVQDPPEITEVEWLVERNNAPFPDSQELTDVVLSDPLPPETRYLFGTTLMTIETRYPEGSYEGEIWLHTDGSESPIVPLVFAGTVTAALPGDDGPGDAPDDVGSDMGPDVGADVEADGPDTDPPDGGGDAGQPDAGDAGLDAGAGGDGDSGCCAQAATSRDPSESWLLLIGLALLGLIRRRQQVRQS